MLSAARHVDLLDYIRGVAIISVLLFHTLGTVYGYDALPWKGWFRDFSAPGSFLYFLPLSSCGQAGVAIFFVVSGFCIHMSFQKQGQKWGSFFIRRFFRIYPPYLAALIFSALVIMTQSGLNLHSREVWVQLLTHLFLIHNCDPSTFFGLNASFWSLAVEAQLYLLYPALLLIVGKLGWRRSLLILAGCELLIRSLDGLMQTLAAENTIWGQVVWCLACSPLGYWFSWTLGASIADAFLKNQPLPFISISPILCLGGALLSNFARPLSAFPFLLFALMTAAVTSRLLSGARTKIQAPQFSLHLLQKIGLWSYSIYLLHQPLLEVYSSAIIWAVPGEYRPAPVAFLLMAATWLAVIPFSILWFQVFELPGIALGKRMIQEMAIGNVAPGDQSHLQPHPVVKQQTRGVTSGRYGLMVGALVVTVVGSLFVGAKLTPPDPAKINNRAWSLATSPEATDRNGTLAVKLAEDACQRTQYQKTIMVGTLAAAYAEAGRFAEAISTAQRACGLAAQNGETNLLQRNQELLALYQDHQPYRERQTDARK